ncbi:PDZ domain-containing protein 7-like isoform X3 [Crassostrea virginica]
MDRGVTRRQTAVEKFSEVCREVLTERERRGLHKLLSDYYRRRRVERLIPGLFKVIREENRMEVIHVLRRLIPYTHLQEFDRQTRQRRARGELKTFFWEEEDDGIGTTVSFSSESDSEEEVLEGSDVHDITLKRDGANQSLGLSIRGGSEHGLGVYVSDVTPDSIADRAGVLVGDQILAVDGVSLKDKSSSVVGSLLTRGLEVNMTLKWAGHLPKWRLVKEKTAWFDHEKKTVICGELEKCGSVHYIKGLDVDVPERRVTLVNDGVLGLNIRGGAEFGLGIYVSSLDPGGQAESQGVKVGDQITEVNGVTFDNVTHAKAIQILTSDDHIIITLRDVGRYPAFKEVYGKFSWTKGNLKAGTRKNAALHVKVPVEVLSHRSRDTISESAVNGGLPLQSEIYLPSASQGSCKDKVSVNSDSELDDLEFGNLEMWKHGEGFHNPAYSGIRKNDYTSSNYDDASDTDEGSGVRGEYSMGVNVPRFEEFELRDIKNKRVTAVDISRETQFKTSSTCSGDDAVYIAKTPSRQIVMAEVTREDVINLSERSYGSESCSLNLSCSPETRRYTAWSDEDRKSGDGETLSPASTRRSKAEDSEEEWGSGTDSPDLTTEYKVNSMTSSKASSLIVDDAKKQEDHGVGGVRDNDVMGSAHDSPNSYSVDGYTSLDRQNSTGFVVSDEEAVVMRSFDRQISDIEDRLSAIGNEEVSNHEESDDFSSPGRIKEERQLLSSSFKETHRSYVQGTASRRSPVVSFELEGTLEVRAEESDDDGRLTPHTVDYKDGASSPMTEISGSPRAPKAVAMTTTRESTSRKRALGNWKILRDKVKGSLRIKPLSRKGLEERLKEMSQEAGHSGRSVVPSTKFHKTTVSPNSIRSLEEAAQQFLNPRELSDMLTQIGKYHDCHDLERLLEVLLAMLDTPEKVLLLREIRSVIYPVDIYRFELSVSRYEKEAFEKLSTKLHLYLNHEKSKKPRKHLLVTETDEHGHFYVKSVEQLSREQEMKQAVVDVLTEARDGVPHPGTDLLPRGSPYQSNGTHSIPGDSRREIGLAEVSATSQWKTITANISKNKQNLGLCVSGGLESRVQPEIKVDQVLAGGAAADEPAIKPGMVILSIDGQSMLGVRHATVVDALRSSFSNKRKVNMTLVLRDQSCPGDTG